MKTIIIGEETIQKTVRKVYPFKNRGRREGDGKNAKQKDRFDKDCLSETDMDKILAIC